MKSSNLISILAVLLGFLAFSEAAVSPFSKRIQRQLIPEGPITDGVKNNVIGVLSRLGSATDVVGTNVSRAAAVLVRGIVREGFNLGSVAAYMPRLIFLDGPNQFIETLRLIRSNAIRMPNDLNSAIDNLITFTGSVRDSGITGHLSPVVEFFPNIFTGVEKFVQDVMYNVFAWIGPLPGTASFDKTINAQNLRVVSTTPAAAEEV